MRANNGKILAAFIGALLLVYAGLALLKGGLYIGKHEGDTLHLVQILFRMQDGDWPHLDFVTPIGILAFAPIVMFLKAGLGAGQAMLAGQILVASVLSPFIWWVARSRFSGGWAYLFAVTIVVLCVAMVPGEAEDAISISMHYNRWAWAAAFLAITTAMLKPRTARTHALLDGVLVGFMMAAMALTKATYFAAFFLPVLIGLLARGAGRTVLWAIVAGLLSAVVATMIVGTPTIWLAYLGDLLNVAGSEVRPQPGHDFSYVVSAPAYLGGSLVMLASVVVMRQAGRRSEGLMLLLLAPAFFYVTYQNYGNDPQWLWLLGLLLFARLPDEGLSNGFGWNLRLSASFCAVAAFALATPSIVNLLASPMRHYALDAEKYAPLIPGSEVHENLRTYAPRAFQLDFRAAMDGEGTAFASYKEYAKRDSTSVKFLGEDIPFCTLEVGLVGWFETIANDLANWDGGKGKQFFTADLLSSHWLYADLTPLKKGAPWYYGELSGIENADYLLVPNCPVSAETRKTILNEISAQRWAGEMKEVRRTELYTLYTLPGEKAVPVSSTGETK
ncbi:hypothetical protein SAMN04488030_0869 [Aliiroseovarius halocynthiae]|uniref:Glycosyltransferase RgtA/B/C/D-like domain-containing protein n=1 Tax=Aliiroseovarius halocynthiae TaxID=985055 RepID=A0A545SV29_9RHOB|nr:hypothetical protein [Aliiroseovarius halocynthiae]TQV68814.1 hypothetical protein FIL88_04325 [Aliiroseovarius halocynthiae]SMR71242.1 hypothetical protein SAMN04488030_0869 [Aliiroseovarius halocynthiae]